MEQNETSQVPEGTTNGNEKEDSGNQQQQQSGWPSSPLAYEWTIKTFIQDNVMGGGNDEKDKQDGWRLDSWVGAFSKATGSEYFRHFTEVSMMKDSHNVSRNETKVDQKFSAVADCTPHVVAKDFRLLDDNFPQQHKNISSNEKEDPKQLSPATERTDNWSKQLVQEGIPPPTDSNDGVVVLDMKHQNHKSVDQVVKKQVVKQQTRKERTLNQTVTQQTVKQRTTKQQTTKQQTAKQQMAMQQMAKQQTVKQQGQQTIKQQSVKQRDVAVVTKRPMRQPYSPKKNSRSPMRNTNKLSHPQRSSQEQGKGSPKAVSRNVDHSITTLTTNRSPSSDKESRDSKPSLLHPVIESRYEDKESKEKSSVRSTEILGTSHFEQVSTPTTTMSNPSEGKETDKLKVALSSSLVSTPPQHQTQETSRRSPTEHFGDVGESRSDKTESSMQATETAGQDHVDVVHSNEGYGEEGKLPSPPSTSTMQTQNDDQSLVSFATSIISYLPSAGSSWNPRTLRGNKQRGMISHNQVRSPIKIRSSGKRGSSPFFLHGLDDITMTTATTSSLGGCDPFWNMNLTTTRKGMMMNELKSTGIRQSEAAGKKPSSKRGDGLWYSLLNPVTQIPDFSQGDDDSSTASSILCTASHEPRRPSPPQSVVLHELPSVDEEVTEEGKDHEQTCTSPIQSVPNDVAEEVEEVEVESGTMDVVSKGVLDDGSTTTVAAVASTTTTTTTSLGMPSNQYCLPDQAHEGTEKKEENKPINLSIPPPKKPSRQHVGSKWGRLGSNKGSRGRQSGLQKTNIKRTNSPVFLG